ncbi:MAG: response regulator transcription factor [Leptotrichiaceae bacterium]|nr:response regulator transcription factor [Leptotrichiaceae bacterium]MBP7100260.1 response regulator transcription factor [Leptotrichiaceae bacterium]MBP7739267.1 response regulator transcription factor [Leptotrichiaceae bacterium]MBP9629005.1 response regulator transcription factor [Leptotrichiaceae bacterium]
MCNILIADDNKQIAAILSEYAKKNGFKSSISYDGEEALNAVKNNDFDIILLDVMMPKKDGFEVCKEIRKFSNVPIIMITAKGEDYEKIMGLDIGADDYIVKPFSPGEVIARVRAILRRVIPLESNNENSSSKVFIFDNLNINLNNFTVTIDTQFVSLTKKEIELLWTIASNPKKVFTRDDLLDSIWGFDYFGDSRTVDSHIKRLRAKLDHYPHEKWNIKTIWGVGYKFESNE